MAIVCPTSAAMQHLLFCSLFLFLLCCVSNTVPIYGAGVARTGFHTTTKCSGCGSGPIGGSRGLPMKPRHGPCSKTGHPQQPPSPQEISDLESSFSLRESTSKQHGRSLSQLFENDGGFIVEVGIGTTGKKYNLFLDTGSHVTWVQCSSCVNCLNGASGFDPAASSTYSSGSCIPTGEDNYTISYYDGSGSKGKYGCDTLTLDPPDAFPKFQFGCGMDNKGDFGEGVDGVLGLGRGPFSFLSQTASKYKSVFSYSLTHSNVSQLLFGDDAMSQSSFLQFTPLVPGSSNYYYVELLGISVANKQLNISSWLSTKPATIIDIGTVITRLPPLVYSALRAAFEQAMSNYARPYPKRGEGGILDTCYDLHIYNKEVKIPEIVLHFGGGADVVLNGECTVWRDNPSHICLAFAESTETGLTIIGNRQLSGTVLYDIPEGRIGFGNDGCPSSQANTDADTNTGSSCSSRVIEII